MTTERKPTKREIRRDVRLYLATMIGSLDQPDVRRWTDAHFECFEDERDRIAQDIDPTWSFRRWSPDV